VYSTKGRTGFSFPFAASSASVLNERACRRCTLSAVYIPLRHVAIWSALEFMIDGGITSTFALGGVVYCALLLVFAVIVIRGLINGTNRHVEPLKGMESSSRLHVRLGQRSFFSELGGVRSTALSANQSFSEVTVRNVFEASCPGPLAQKTVALFVTPSTHNRMFMLALLNHDVVPSWHSPTSTKSFSRTTDLNL
jgi:hypothetical protein